MAFVKIAFLSKKKQKSLVVTATYKNARMFKKAWKSQKAKAEKGKAKAEQKRNYSLTV